MIGSHQDLVGPESENASTGPQLHPASPSGSDDASYLWIAAAVVAAGTAWVVFLLWNGFFYVDDFLRLIDASRSPLNKTYLLSSVFGHLVPGWRLVYFVLQRLAPLNYAWVVVYTAIAQGLVLTFFYRILTTLFGRRRSNHLFVAAYAISPAQVLTLLWFANTLHVVTSLVFMLATTDLFLRYLASHRRRYLLAALLVAPLGLMFFEKTSLLLAALPLLVVMICSERGSWAAGLRRSGQALVRLIPVWIGIALPIAAYTWYEVTHHYAAQASLPPVGLWARATGIAWIDGIGSALIGGPFRWHAQLAGYGLPTPVTVVSVLAVLACVIAIAASQWRSARAWRGWVFAAIMFTLSFSLVVLGRLEVSGLIIAHDPAHTGDALGFVLLGIAVAFVPISGSLVRAVTGAPPLERSHRTSSIEGRSVPRWLRGALVGIAALGAIGYVAGSMASNLAFRSQWQAASPRAYFANVEQGLARLEASHRPFSLFNVPVPYTVALPSWWPDTLVQPVLGIRWHSLSYDDTGRPLYVVDQETGRVVPGTFRVVATAPAGSTSLRASKGAVVDGRVCVPTGASTLSVVPTMSLAPGSYLLRITYQGAASVWSIHTAMSPATTPVAPWVEPAFGMPGDRAAAITALPPGSPRQVTMTVVTARGVCISEIEIGLAVPKG